MNTALLYSIEKDRRTLLREYKDVFRKPLIAKLELELELKLESGEITIEEFVKQLKELYLIPNRGETLL
jgi:rRNA processing protein Krr1/Pno1